LETGRTNLIYHGCNSCRYRNGGRRSRPRSDRWIGRSYNVIGYYLLHYLSQLTFNTNLMKTRICLIIYDEHLVCVLSERACGCVYDVCVYCLGNASQNVQPTLIQLCSIILLWLWVCDNKSTFLPRRCSDGVVMIASGPFPFFFHSAFFIYRDILSLFSFDPLICLS